MAELIVDFALGVVAGAILRTLVVRLHRSQESPLRKALKNKGDGAAIDLARIVGVSETSVWRWANRGVKPHRHFRKEIAAFVGVEEEELWPTTT